MSWRSRLAAVGTDVAADSDDEVLACDPLFRDVVPEHCVKIGRLRDLQRQVEYRYHRTEFEGPDF